MRLTAEGRLFGCLARKECYEIESLIRSEYLSAGVSLIETIHPAQINKRNGHRFNTCETMAEIGG